MALILFVIVYVEDVLAKADFEPETFTHDVEKFDFDLQRNKVTTEESEV